MAQNQQIQEHKLDSNDLAFERTALAESRTMMAWVRTSVSMISFGFTIYKFFQEHRMTHTGEERLLTPRIVGMIMMIMGLLCLLWGYNEHRTMIRKLQKSYPALEKSKSSVLALLILVFGMLLFFAALFRQ